MLMHVHLRKTPLISLPIILSTVACTVGPDFKPPKAPDVERYTEQSLPEKTASVDHLQGGAAQHFNPQQEIPARWWKLFHSPQLNALIEEGLKHNPDLRSASATLRASEEELQGLAGKTFYPSIGLDVFGGRERLSSFDSLEGTPGASLDDFPPQLLSMYNANVSVAYVFDVFGANRRAIESLQAEVEYQRYQVEAVYLTLAANIATSAITEAELRAQINALKALIALEEKQLSLMQQQFKIGSVNRLDIYAQETELAQTRAQLPPLENALAQTRHALAALIGGYPGKANLPQFTLEDLHLPADLPVSVPSTLIKQRPDIRAAEALLHQATADIGVATADLLPSFPIVGSFGPNSNTLSNFFNANNIAWAWQADVVQTVFEGGAGLANRRAAIAAFEAAFADYQAAVLMGFQNVADSLTALETDARALKENAEAEKAAKAALVLVHKQYKAGGASYVDVLLAEMQYQQTVNDRIAAQAARYVDTVALFQALGGGWWNRGKS